MASNLAKAAVGALAVNGGGDGSADIQENKGPKPKCPTRKLAKFHDEDFCLKRISRPPKGDIERSDVYHRLKDSGAGASMVPDQDTIVCPMDAQSLESPTAVKGFDTTWILENTAKTPVVIAWVVDGVEWSPFKPDVKPMDDPNAILQPGDWIAVPTFESFVYHVREIDPKTNGMGEILLQHRAGLVPIKNRQNYPCDNSTPDIEPVQEETAEIEEEYARTPTHKTRRCNIIDVGFRNHVGCPVNMYFASHLAMKDVPDEGFNCGEEFKLHLGLKPATQDFMKDWESATKFEGSFIGHTFVARLASNPDVVIDSYTLDTTKVVDCPNRKQPVARAAMEAAEAIVDVNGVVLDAATLN